MCMWKDLIRKTNHGESLWTKAQVIWYCWFLQILTPLSPSPALVLSPFYTSPTPFPTAAGVSCSMISFHRQTQISLSLCLLNTHALIFKSPPSLSEECSMWHVALWLLILVNLLRGEWLVLEMWLCSKKCVFFMWCLFHACTCVIGGTMIFLINNSSLPPHGYTLFLKLLGKADLFSTNQKCCRADNNAGDE